MDSDSDWTATGLFSPSKAKAHQAQAKDWNFVDSWLAKRSASKRLPQFERNEDTLQALLALATLNDAADEQRNAIDRVEKASLSALTTRTHAPSDGLHELTLSQLDRKADLDLMAELSVTLDCSTPSALEMSGKIVDLQHMQFTANQQLHRTEAQLRALKAEQDRAQAALRSLKDEAFHPTGLPEQTAEWTRSSKHLRAKIGEYDDRLSSTRPEAKADVTFEVITKQAADLEEQEKQLQGLQKELKAFQSLPNNAKAARVQLETARDELRKLIQKRDALFEKLAGS